MTVTFSDALALAAFSNEPPTKSNAGEEALEFSGFESCFSTSRSQDLKA